MGREGSERAQGREEGHTHEPAVHPASGPHLELTQLLPEKEGGFLEIGKNTSGRAKRSLCFTDSNGEVRVKFRSFGLLKLFVIISSN